MQEDDNIIKQVCKELEKNTIFLKHNITKKDDLFLIDIAIKELVKTRNTLDFIHKEQITSINWQKVLKAMQ